jgi:valyl-tRNA synthetase
MPFVTEEIYHQLKSREDDLCVKQFSDAKILDKNILTQGQLLQETISALRDARNKNNIRPKETIRLHILTDKEKLFEPIINILSKQVNAESIHFVKQPVSGGITVVVGTDKFFIETETALDTATQKDQLTKDLDYLKGFLISVEKKLSNERFVQNAKPEVVDIEKKKKADAEEKIKAIEESLAALK